MTEEAPAPAPAAATAPAKASVKAKKKNTSRAKSTGLSLPKQIVAVVAESKSRKGVSSAAIKKMLAVKNVDVVKENKRINLALRSLVAKEVLTQVKGTGASGSFKLAKVEKPKTTVRKAPSSPRKRSSSAVKAKKTGGTKKSPVKKSAPAKKPKAGAGAKISPKKKKKVQPAQKKKVAKKSSPVKKKPAAKKSKPAAVGRVAARKAAKKVAGKKATKKTTKK